MTNNAITGIKKFLKIVRNFWLNVGIVLLMLFLIEGFFSGAFALKDYFTKNTSKPFDWRIEADTYNGAPWVEEYFKELYEVHMRWKPYVYWRRIAYEGKYINIDSNGIRSTPNSNLNAVKGYAPLKIFVFGGSTIWGTGVKDESTIPAILARELENIGVNVEVTNFGESGYVSTQETIELSLQLQNNNIPDIVIFYDGINDSFSAYQQKIAGIPQNEMRRENAFGLIKPKNYKTLMKYALIDIIDNSSIGRATKSFGNRFIAQKRANANNQKALQEETGSFNKKTLAEKVLNVYVKNMRAVSALAAEYEFDVIFYWQPNIFEKEYLSKYENYAHNKRKKMRDFFKEVYYFVEKEDAKLQNMYNFRNIGSILSNVKEPLFIDYGHLGERGNKIIALSMSKDVKSLLEKNN